MPGELHPPVQRAGDIPVAEALLHPAEGIVPGVRGALEALQVALQEASELRQPEEEVLLLPELGIGPADQAARFLDLSRLKVPPATLVALVPAGGGIAVWTDPHDIPVREEPLAFRAVALLDHLRIDVAVLLEGVHDGPGPPVVRLPVSHPEVIEADAHPLEDVGEVLMVTVGEFTGGYPLVLGHDHDRGAVVIRAADEEHLLAPPSQETDVEVCGDVGPQVAEVAGTVRVGEPAGYE